MDDVHLKRCYNTQHNMKTREVNVNQNVWKVLNLWSITLCRVWLQNIMLYGCTSAFLRIIIIIITQTAAIALTTHPDEWAEPSHK